MDGIIGPFSLNEFGDVERPIFITQVRGGAFVTKTMTGVVP
jgi:hypothetical protein